MEEEYDLFTEVANDSKDAFEFLDELQAETIEDELVYFIGVYFEGRYKELDPKIVSSEIDSFGMYGISEYNLDYEQGCQVQTYFGNLVKRNV